MEKIITLLIDENTIKEYADHYFTLHPRAKKLPIAHPYHESINAWMILKRMAMNSLKQKWKDFIVWLVDKSGYKNLDIQKCKVIQTVYYPTERRRDIDNSVPKFILDGLVESNMVRDDDCRHITELTLRCFVGSKNPRTEIKIIIE